MGVGRRVRGEGPVPGRFMMIGECIGKEEARTGRVFAARWKRENEIDRYLDGVRLPARHQWFLTTWIKEWCGEEADYTAADFERDEPELVHEVEKVQPEFIVALGRSVTRWFLGDVDMEEVHGIPWKLPADSPRRSLFADPELVIVVPIINPAAGFRSPELSAQCTYDFSQLEGVLDGTISPRVLYDDPIPDPVYKILDTVEQIDEVMLEAETISTDSEGWPWKPWSVQITVRSGESFVIRCRNIAVGTSAPLKRAGLRPELLLGTAHDAQRSGDRRVHPDPLVARFVYWVDTCRGQYQWVFHNALHDLAVFRAIGIDTTRLAFDDTMLMSYVLQLEPQGLKPLCARWCGMKMEHYDEVMGDAGTRLAVDWILSALECEDILYHERCHEEFVRQTTTPYVDGRGKLQPGRRLKVDPKLPKSDLHKSLQRCLASKTPRKLWGDQVVDRHVDAEPKYGPMWEATLDHVPVERAIAYAGRDSDGTHRLRPALAACLRAHDLDDVYQADLGTVALIDRMQQTGIRPDLGHFAALSEVLTGELACLLESLRGRIREGAGLRDGSRLDSGGGLEEGHAAFNPNSSDHVSGLLFERFGVQSLKRTPGGDPSTNDKVLEALEKDQNLDRAVRDIVGDIRQYREFYKLKNTFCDKIPALTHRWPWDGRIHPTFRITRVVTGRLAASDPNILALPKHGKFATRFRAGFVSGDDTVLASWDLSQIELRVLAHLSQDPVLLNAFRSGIDLHATLAQRIFGVAPKDQDKSAHRLPAKAVNFGIPMGMTNIGLCLELRKNGVDIDEDDAQRWLNETMALYKEVPNYQQAKIAQARRYGFVTDIRGRRRYIGGIRSFDRAVQSEAERFAFSTPIQAGAQEIMKEAEGYVYRDILLPAWEAGVNVEPLVQIHDDLVLEPQREFLLALNEQMMHAMTQVPAHWLSVPIGTSGDYGNNWGEMVPIVCPHCTSANTAMAKKVCATCGEKMD